MTLDELEQAKVKVDRANKIIAKLNETTKTLQYVVKGNLSGFNACNVVDKDFAKTKLIEVLENDLKALNKELEEL